MTALADDHELPRRPRQVRALRQRIAAVVLRLFGWTPDGDPPAVDKVVVIAAPHTSWWDGFWMVACAWYWDVDLRWLVKAAASKYPFGLGWVIRKVGGILVDRSTPHGLVEQLTGEFARQETLFLAIAPEGTRARGEYWKSGFYHLARAAQVPVCLSYLDYGRKRAGFGPCLWMTGDLTADMEKLRAFYADVRGHHLEKFTPPRLREEG